MKAWGFQNFYILLFLVVSLPVNAQQTDPLQAGDGQAQVKWVDSIYSGMSLHEKLGQLFMVDVFSRESRKETDKVAKLIAEQHIGGVIFSKGGPFRQARLNNEYQALSKVPLLIGMDAEWGLAMRLDSTFALPWNMTLGAVEDLKLIEEAGASISRHSKRLGVHINFAPVIDINTNPENPIIGNRSFGENKENVTRKALAFMNGMHREGVLSSAKHFPGHGDTDSDSHKTLPSILFSRERIEETELYPYRKLIDRGVSSIMVAHLNVPGLEIQKNLPSSLSQAIVTGLLKEKLHFKGLIFTDALNMKGVSNHAGPGETDLAAFLAGNDVLLISKDVPKAVSRLAEAYETGIITEERLQHSVKKILSAKYKAGLNKPSFIDLRFLHKDLYTIKDKLLYEQLIENAVSVIKNNRNILPIKNLEDSNIAYVNFGDDDGAPFLAQLSKYTRVDWVKAEKLGDLLDRLESYDRVILGFHKSNASPWADHKFSKEEVFWVQEIARKNKTILSVFSSPYSLLDLKSYSGLEGIVVSYQNSIAAQEKSAQIIFGALPAKGKLPVSIGNSFPAGTGHKTQQLDRLSYGLPEAVGMNSSRLSKIDSLVKRVVDQKMAPGLQVVVARKGKVVYQKNYGHHTYEKNIPVSDSSVYDLASLTKILASLPLIMELEEKGVLDLDATLGELMPVFQNSNKASVSLRDMLTHYARLKAWLPFYVATLDRKTKKPSPEFYREFPEEGFSTAVAQKMYIRDDIRDSIVSNIRNSSLEKMQAYKYSDLPFYIMKYYLEEHYEASLDQLTRERFYDPLGASYTTYLPLLKFHPEQIVPTEDDKLWRSQIVHGYVHDQGAAMQGGIGGHAGLFSTANDVAKIMQMYLNGGAYGGKHYLEPETLDKFNTCFYCEENVRRGVGFDKPQLGNAGPTCGCVSLSSFGHSGFTGTFAWADPEQEIVYVFLSNRTYPDVNNRKLISSNIRSEIQKLIYEAIDF